MVVSVPHVTAQSQQDHFSATMSWIENAAARFQVVPHQDHRRDSSVQCLPCDCTVSGTADCTNQISLKLSTKHNDIGIRFYLHFRIVTSQHINVPLG